MKHEYKFKIFYDDTDATGLVYHSNYLKFFERARTVYLQDKNIYQKDLLKNEICFVVAKADLSFLKPAFFEDELIVFTDILYKKKTSVNFCQILVNSDNKVLCKANITIACVHTKNLKPLRIPEQILQEINK
ncbi:YbgC/FadM family acyl-CoA thioesterase [Paraphotobacterium marinum]|uniref:YbgC/FadM family acyl-CoA thioesterase n=2 Tax=Paraphotobacterium marinum TaxID=1755811 RepID=UPI0039EAFC00